jgi:predicted O-linked N-acetylglucosamine transferase (SPINDLY family)
VGNILQGLFERHDKSRFEITAVSLIPADQSSTGKRIQAAVDRFTDVSAITDATAAAMLRDWEIDIAVDLNGLTGGKRTTIRPRRPAPLQVSYIGYPGTMGVSFVDYLIADRMVIPEEHKAFYSEKLAYLPDCYLPSDVSRVIGAKVPTRQEQGLPDQGFIFACFNNVPKISPEIFDIWMRLLKAVPGSVFWLAQGKPAVQDNLRKEASARGVAPERLVFSQFERNVETHLARQSLADIFLDTTPYNAHSTGNDALWAGLPLLTVLGNDFQSRVAASLLTAIGMPELITTSLAEYEELALLLARDPQRLAALRQKLSRNRRTAPLFDIPRYMRNLEAIYEVMWRRQQDGLPPESFSLNP